MCVCGGEGSEIKTMPIKQTCQCKLEIYSLKTQTGFHYSIKSRSGNFKMLIFLRSAVTDS